MCLVRAEQWEHLFDAHGPLILASMAMGLRAVPSRAELPKSYVTSLERIIRRDQGKKAFSGLELVC